MTSEISVKTNEKRQLIDITSNIERAIAKFKVREGNVYIFAKHTTCALIICEMEDNLNKDVLAYLEKEGPKGPFSHTHGGQSHTPSHILSSIIGSSQTIPLTSGQMALGTWQRICLVELDGPRNREIIIKVV